MAPNSAWQQLSVLAHNLISSFQLDTLATPKPRSRKRINAYLIRSMRTLRFLLVTRAGRLTRIDGRIRLTGPPARALTTIPCRRRMTPGSRPIAMPTLAFALRQLGTAECQAKVGSGERILPARVRRPKRTNSHIAR